MTRAIFAAACLVCFAPGIIGCGHSEAIEVSQRPRTEPPRPPLDVDAFRARLDHVLAAIVPHDDDVWFVKLNAPARHVAAVREPFLKLVGTVAFADDRERPSWTLPAGWRELPGDAMTAAKASVPVGDETLTLTLTRLPKTDDWNALLAGNVNRWLRQLGEEPLEEGEVVKLARDQATAAGKATWFELTGILPKDDMPAGHPPVARNEGASKSPPARESGPKSAPREASSPATAEGFTFAAPDHWSLQARQANRKATFAIKNDAGTAELRVSAWPGQRGQGMGSLALNLGRWSGMVGIGRDPQKLKELEASARDMKVGDADAQYVELASPEDASPRKAMLVAMVYRNDRVWFFVLSGNQESLDPERKAFEKFLKSVEFE